MSKKTKIEIYDEALSSIIWKANKRFMLRNPPPPEEFWKGVMEHPIELVTLLEWIGQIANQAIKDAANAE